MPRARLRALSGVPGGLTGDMDNTGEYMREYRDRNRVHLLEYARKYRAEHRNTINKLRRAKYADDEEYRRHELDRKRKAKMIEIKLKRLHPNAVIPKRGSQYAAGYDLTAVSVERDPESGCFVYHTGLAFELPHGFCGLLMPRSSIYRTGSVLSNSVGLLDEDYRGEVMFKFYGVYGNEPPYKVGERIAQLVVIRRNDLFFNLVEELGSTRRGTGGYGSTGK